jgi:cytochrome P450 family 142 subfamily A polypeptide 1
VADGVAPAIEFLSGELFGDRARAAYEWMRRNSPVYYDESSGLWGVATYDLLLAAERDPQTFSNAGGSRPGVGPMPWMIDMDAPEHLKRRRLVSAGFTPGRVRASESRLREICDDLIDAVCERGECDLVHDLAAQLPLIVIGDMLGIAPQDRHQLLRWSDAMLSSLSGEPEKLMDAAVAFGEYAEYSRATIAARRAEPTDDLVSVLVHAEVDGERLTDDEVLFESLLILVGGDETTRHVISGGMEQLMRHPDQAAQLADDPELLTSAVEEMLRWVSPIKEMNRTVQRDVEIGGQQLTAGDHAIMLYESANYDESQFPDPYRFDITRSPNDHVAFGSGPHFCLGATLARVEVSVMVARLLARLPDLHRPDDEPLPTFLGAITHLPVRFTPTAPLRDGGGTPVAPS